MSAWHFYRLSDGLFTGRSMTGPAADIAANCAADEGVVQGVTDWRRQRVDLATGALLDLPEPPVDAAQLAADHRSQRDRRLAACDWVRARADDLGQPVPAAWLTYRQALRDITAQPGFPLSITWPTPPT